MEVEILKREDILYMTTEQINEIMISYRDKWTSSIACMKIMHNCDMIKSVHSNVGLLETTRMEAEMRGRMIMGIVR